MDRHVPMVDNFQRRYEVMDDSGDENNDTATDDFNDESDGMVTEENISFPTNVPNPDSREFSFDDILDFLTSKQWIVIAVLFSVLCSTFLFNVSNQSSSSKSKWKEIYQQLKLKKENFPSQDVNLWPGITSVLKNLEKEPIEPAVYLLAFEEDSVTSCSCVIEIITTLATKLLDPRNARKWLLLNGTEILKSTSRDPGDLVDAISKQLANSRIVVVTDVQKIPAKLAQGFHSLVDTYTSMSKQPGAVYIFTLMVPHVDDASMITKTVEDILLASWKELNRDELQPLVTRISNFVLHISREKQVSTCPLKIDSTIEVRV